MPTYRQLLAGPAPLSAEGLLLYVPDGTGAGVVHGGPDTLVSTVAAGWVTDDFAYEIEGPSTLSAPTFTAGAGSALYQINSGAFGTIEQANAQIAALAAVDPLAVYLLTLRITATGPAVATHQLTVTY